jgi:transglutaminase-like putative cysteine protease
MTARRRLSIGCMFTYVAEIPTPTVFMVRPAISRALSTGGDRWLSDPPAQVHGYTDIYGNDCVRTELPAGRSQFGFSAVADVPDATEDFDPDAPEVPTNQLPDHTLMYTLPSRYCLPDLLAAEAWQRFGGLEPGYKRVQTICDHVNGHLTFQYGSSTATSTAVDVNNSRYGVCRDFTHLAISFCRALNIPARYTFGYLPDLDVPADPAPMDFAAWMEVWLGDRWWTFDPRNNARRKGRVVIGRGRDATDVAVATTFGGPLLESMTVQAEELALSLRGERAPRLRRDPLVEALPPVVEPGGLGVVIGRAGDVGGRHPPPPGLDGHVGEQALPDVTDADQPVQAGMGHEDHVCGRAGADGGEGPAGVGREQVGHRRRPFGQIGMASPPETLDAPTPAQRRPVPALGEQQQSVAPAEAGRQPSDLPDLVGLGPAASGAARGRGRATAQKRVRHPVGHDVQARVQLQRRLHDHPGAPLADGEQVMHEQQRVARAGVPAEHDEWAVAGQQRVRRRGHLDAQPAGAARLPVDQVEEPPHDRVVAGPVGLGV